MVAALNGKGSRIAAKDPPHPAEKAFSFGPIASRLVQGSGPHLNCLDSAPLAPDIGGGRNSVAFFL
jgi:hypothetical protein